MNIKYNVGTIDKLIRYALGIGFLVFAIIYQQWLLLIGTAVMIGTAYLGFCWLYKLFGLNTCRVILRGEDKKETESET